MASQKGKNVKIFMAYKDTPAEVNPCWGGGYYLALDFSPETKQQMIGIGIRSSDVAAHLARHFALMAELLKKQAK